MPVIVDGGLGEELARRGFAFSTALWSGEAIIARPDLLESIHRAYLAAGARVIETATYQLSHATLRGLGYDDAAIDGVFARAVELARDAIGAHRASMGNSGDWGDSRDSNRRTEYGMFVVAGSLGPYGATLGNGGEYSASQYLDPGALYAFHAERTRSLARAAPDVFLFETIPSRAEGLIVAQVARDLALRNVWISFACSDGEHTYAGDTIREIATELDKFAGVDVIGVNCTAPQAVAPLVRAIQSASSKPILVCPNLGQHWVHDAHALGGALSETELTSRVPQWLELGVAYLGGCCGVGPDTIAAIASVVAQFTARSA